MLQRPGRPAENLPARAAKIKLLLTDCDGVLTDTGVYYSDAGEEFKRFSIRDGMGVARLRELAGVETGIITGELSLAVKRRAEKLKITEVYLGVKSKMLMLETIQAVSQLSSEQIACIGDDVNDLEILAAVGLSACPRDAMPVVRRRVDYVCRARGGHGAFREFAELIIAASRHCQQGVTLPAVWLGAQPVR
ncbi:MAG: HAD-IIIA family hydrolase [candidate division KSB1 bacterium]|nr:HAD-IIIA family hydrolase [candidate division KSB1 bacterium]MDZ7276173.1 HAD-IIIA family hydrolase [candidate division KSB1 bacterium]MDZ7287047.1 HAD-IIIA family hydrolase [candidate division KSB1 bacterium]MDZ7297028.1 HAD-IIIA family hydrolase [candidate division KSB1 bacterium]MDZ7309363.1 HAD-IIIA family hydrolase [candidate division KSB1 bacterium]